VSSDQDSVERHPFSNFNEINCERETESELTSSNFAEFAYSCAVMRPSHQDVAEAGTDQTMADDLVASQRESNQECDIPEDMDTADELTDDSSGSSSATRRTGDESRQACSYASEGLASTDSADNSAASSHRGNHQAGAVYKTDDCRIQEQQHSLQVSGDMSRDDSKSLLDVSEAVQCYSQDGDCDDRDTQSPSSTNSGSTAGEASSYLVACISSAPEIAERSTSLPMSDAQVAIQQLQHDTECQDQRAADTAAAELGRHQISADKMTDNSADESPNDCYQRCAMKRQLGPDRFVLDELAGPPKPTD
jgi:hypothetical protein